MELDKITKETNGSTPRRRENGLNLRPVSPEASGVGLPYAPTDWPSKGDVWTWKVGRRVAITGHFLDRYLYPPKRLRKFDPSGGRKAGLASKLAVQRFLKSACPDADISAFFASFSWKIPAKKGSLKHVAQSYFVRIPEEIAELSVSDPQSNGVTCKAGNKKCNSLFSEEKRSSLVPLPCELCCSEPHFCRDCCCILCSKIIDLKFGGYSYIKCEAMVDGCMCGHVAHLTCALRAFMAGTVGGSIGLDAEYYCRRCDAKTPLVPHVTMLLKTCEPIDSRDDVEKILNMGVCILRGSWKTDATELLSQIEAALAKLKCGTSLEDIWKDKESDSAILTGALHNGIVEIESPNRNDSPDSRPYSVPVLSVSSDYQSEYLKLEYEIDEVLQALTKAQECEYQIAEERLYAQKNYLRNLYQQLDKERSEQSNWALNTILNRVDQIKQEVIKLKEMEEVANGFGRTSKGILREHFSVEIED